MTDLVRTVTLDDLAAMLRDKGFRAEKIDWPGGREALASATGGVGFTVVAGKRRPRGLSRLHVFREFPGRGARRGCAVRRLEYGPPLRPYPWT